MLPMMPEGVLNLEFIALVIDRLDIAFERAVEHHVAGSRERTGPDRELLGLRLDNLAFFCIPGDEVAHAAIDYSAWGTCSPSRQHRAGLPCSSPGKIYRAP